MDNPTRDWFLRRAAGAVGFLLEQFEPTTGRFHPSHWDERYNNAIYALAYLYSAPHPQNPHTGSQPLVDAALAGGEAYVRTQNPFGEWPHAPSGGYCLAEWPAYYLAETLALLQEGMDHEQRTRWRTTLERYATHACRRPFSLTAPSNEAWKCLVLFRVGQLLEREEWCDRARFQRGRLALVQLPEGYWDEPLIGQGPSPTYHHLHLGALGLFAWHAGDHDAPDLNQALTFALATSYPDGTPVDCLDGRSAFAPEAALSSAPALAQHPQGRTRLRALQRTLDELRDDDPDRQFSSTWSAFIEPCFLVDAYRCFPGEEERSSGTVSESAGVMRVGKSWTLRQPPWFTAMDAEVSDLALVSADPSTFQRQSRLSLWHDRWGVIVGGGSQARTSHLAPANVVVATGHRDVSCSFGEVRSLTRKEEGDPLTVASAYCQPRGVTRSVAGEAGGEVEYVFGHGAVTVRVRFVSAEICEVDFLIDLQDAQTVCCQLPLLITSSTRVAALGNSPRPVTLDQAEWTTRTLDRALVLTRPDREVQVVVYRPHDATLKLHMPLHPGHGWQDDERFAPTFALGLLSAEPSDPNGKKQLTYRIVLEPVEPTR